MFYTTAPESYTTTSRSFDILRLGPRLVALAPPAFAKSLHLNTISTVVRPCTRSATSRLQALQSLVSKKQSFSFAFSSTIRVSIATIRSTVRAHVAPEQPVLKILLSLYRVKYSARPHRPRGETYQSSGSSSSTAGPAIFVSCCASEELDSGIVTRDG